MCASVFPKKNMHINKIEHQQNMTFDWIILALNCSLHPK